MRPARHRQQRQLPALPGARPPRVPALDICKLCLRKEGIKYVFYQDIYRAADNRLVLKGVVEAVCVVNGRLSASPLFDQLFAPYLNEKES